MKTYSAPWVLPVSSDPLPNSAIVVDDNDIIVDIGPRETIRNRHSSFPETFFDHAILMPGLVNAHTHLELSMMKGAVDDGLSCAEWAYRVITQRASFDSTTIQNACQQAIHELIASGVVAVGDIANHDCISDPCLQSSGLLAHVFHEITGFPDAVAVERFAEFQKRLPQSHHPTVSHSLTPHALYSVSSRLLKMIDKAARSRALPESIHLAESSDETTFLETGSGPMKEMIRKLGRWDDSWSPPRTTPIGYASRLDLLGPHLIAVHAVHVSDDDIETIRKTGVHVCVCPRSNLKINVGGSVPVRKLLDAGIPVCMGTDSLASNDDLSLWNEAYALRRLEPTLSEEQLLQCMTLNGARALGWESKIGSIEIGKEARCLILHFDSAVADGLKQVLHPRRIEHLSSRINREFAPGMSTH